VRRLKKRHFRATDGVNPSKVASFVQKITTWEADNSLAEMDK
jgi:hypothetical protein